MDLLYSLLKVTSMIATGAFGALGLLTKYKDEKGKITRWGKVAFGGILISSSISLGLYALETSRAKDAAIKAKDDFETTSLKLETIQKDAQTTADQQKESLKETRILKSNLADSLERSKHIAKGMENNLTAAEAVLRGNEKILTGVTNTLQTQGAVLAQSEINLLAVLSKDMPITNVGYEFELGEDSRQGKDAFEYLFSRIPPEYKAIAHGEIDLEPFTGIETFVQYSYEDGKVVRTNVNLKSEKGFVPPEIYLPDFLGRAEPRFLERPRIIIYQNPATDATINSAAVAYNDLLHTKTIGTFSLSFERWFESKEEESLFLARNPSLKPKQTSLIEGPSTVVFEVPPQVKESFSSYWRTNFERGNLYVSLKGATNLTITCEFNIREIRNEYGGVTAWFQASTDPKFELGFWMFKKTK